MEQSMFFRVLNIADVGAILVSAPGMAAAASKTAVKITLDNLDKARAIVPSTVSKTRVAVYTTPFAGVVVNSLTPNVCTVSYPVELVNNEISTPKPGLCRFSASVTNTDKYTGSVEYSFTIPKLKQNGFYPFGTYPSQIPTPVLSTGNAYARLRPLLPGKTRGAEFGTPYQIITSDPSVCTATDEIDPRDEGLTIRPVAVSSGNCTITVLRPANEIYEKFHLD